MLPAPDLPIPSDEAPVRQLAGFAGRLAAVLSVGLSLYALYWVLFVVQPQVYRVSFLLFPLRRGDLRGVSGFDWALVAASVVTLAWPLVDFNAFIYRAADPRPIDLVLGSVAILLVLEAT